LNLAKAAFLNIVTELSGTKTVKPGLHGLNRPVVAFREADFAFRIAGNGFLRLGVIDGGMLSAGSVPPTGKASRAAIFGAGNPSASR